MPRILAQQGETLVSRVAYRFGQHVIALPEFRRRKMIHNGLQRPRSKMFECLIRQGIQTARTNIFLDLIIPPLGIKFGKPAAETGQFRRGESRHGGFNFI